MILEVDRTAVKDVGDLQTSLKESEKGALLLIRRRAATVFVPVEKASWPPKKTEGSPVTSCLPSGTPVG